MTDIRPATNLSPDETVQFFRAKGYATQAHWDELWQQEHSRAFTVTKMLDGDLLAKVRASLDTVLAQGGTFEQWQAATVPTLKAHDWYGKVPGDLGNTGVSHPIFVGEARLRTIYDTNLRVARAAGRWQRIQATKTAQPYLMYDAVHDNRTRPLHRLWGGLDDGKPIILPVDHPAWAIYFPPCGWGCRCGVIQLSERDLRRRGLSVTTDAELIAKGWLTADGQIGGDRKPYRRTDGTVEKVPAGIDPGFAYNPGEYFFQALQTAPEIGPIDVPAITSAPDQPPMPPPRVRPASVLLDPSTSDDAAIRLFLDQFDGPSDGETVLAVDRGGQPLAVSSRFFFRGGNAEAPKLNSDRRQAILLLAETLQDPDEIWTRWEQAIDAAGNPDPRLMRYYVARFEIDGKVRSFVAATTYGRATFGAAGGTGVTAFPPKSKSYLAGDQVRSGTLVYRRS